VDKTKRGTATISTQGKDYRYNGVFVNADSTKDIYSHIKSDIASVLEGFSCTVVTHGPPGKFTIVSSEDKLSLEKINYYRIFIDNFPTTMTNTSNNRQRKVNHHVWRGWASRRGGQTIIITHNGKCGSYTSGDELHRAA
jgi:hypothetical protein